LKVQVFSIHELFDNRINRHLNTLLKKDIQVIYVNASNSKKSDFELKDRVELHHINENFVKDNLKGVFKAWIFMKKQLKKGNADILHVHDPLLIPLLYYAKKMGKVTIYDKHESYEKSKGIGAKLGVLFEKYYINYIDGVVYVNEQQEKYINELNYKAMKLIPNYQSLASYNVAPNKEVENTINIIYIGSLSDVTRNILLMLDVIDRVLEKCPQVNCTIGGLANEEPVIKKLSNISAKHKNFKYNGTMKYSDVITTTVNSDIGLYFAKDDPNNYKSSPNKVYEYLIAGVALVGMGDFMHIDEINESAGKVFPYVANPLEISEYIISLVNDKSKIKHFKENAKKIGGKYTWESVEGRYFDLYDEIKV
jgi:glycosyltransferase involved in cell wall biosynthesis